MQIDITTNASDHAKILRNAPTLIEKYLKPALDDAGQLIARQAKRNLVANGSMAYSTLNKSIQSNISQNGLEAIIAPAAGVGYAKYVEHGSGPGGNPPIQTLIDWLRVKRIDPRTPGMHESELAYLIARKIAHHGIAPKPFLQPAFDSQKPAVIERINAAIQSAIRELH